MSTAAGPNSKGENSLVFAFDLGDVSNSYKGEPTTNVIANPEPLSGWGVSNYLTSTATITYSSDNGIPHMELSSVNVDGSYPRINMANLTSTITDGFSISFEAKSNISNVRLGLALYSVGSTKTTQYATLSTEWQRFKFENLTTGFTLDDGYLRVPSTTSGAVYYIRRIQVEQKTHATPYTAGTRSATQGLLDLTGNLTIDLTNVSFDSNAQMTFDGTDDFAVVQNFQTPLNSRTVELVTKINQSINSNSQAHIYGNSDQPGDSTNDKGVAILYRNNNIVCYIAGYDPNTSPTSPRTTLTLVTAPVVDQPYHIVITHDNITAKAYVNGELVDSRPCIGSRQPNNKLTLGSYSAGYSTRYNGKISMVKVYSKVLSAEEVAANFQVTRKRFNI